MKRIGKVTALLVVTLAVQAVYALEVVNGWTDLKPSEDARLIYVSSSTGNDSNDGSINNPYATFDRARLDLRDDAGDWVLFKSGDVWNEPLGAIKNDQYNLVSGLPEHPIVLTSYGDGPRPIFNIGDDDGVQIWSSTGDNTSNIALVNLHFISETSKGNGVRCLSWGENLLIEGCRFDYCDIVVDPYRHEYEGEVRFTNLTVRRCYVYRNFSTGGHAQGIFVTEVDGLLLEENCFDHNGWYEESDRTKFNHNGYITTYCTGLVARGNIFMRGSSTGLQARCGGDISFNVFQANATQCNWGMYFGDAKPTKDGVTGRVFSNVFFDTDEIEDPSQAGEWGLSVGNVREGRVARNLFYASEGIHFVGKGGHQQEGWVGLNDLVTVHNAIVATDTEHWPIMFIHETFSDVKIIKNLLVAQRGVFRDRDGAMNGDGIVFERNVYDSELQTDWKPVRLQEVAELVGGPEYASLDGFSELWSKQDRHNWNPALCGKNIARYSIRHGFDALKFYAQGTGD